MINNKYFHPRFTERAGRLRLDILTQTLAICSSVYIYNVKIFDPEKQKIVFSNP